MRADGLVDVEIRDEAKTRDGRWVFTFVHRVTGVSVELETHGVDNMKAYKAEHIFPPRIYWNGSSSANPKLDDWSAPGFEPVCTFRPLPPVQERDEEGTDHV
jgi:hypothetical protein